jgi:SlyX protein
MSDARVAELEFQLTHLQRIYEQLNEVVTRQADSIDRLERRIVQLDSLVSELKQAAETTVDPLDEKPPHY